MHHAWVLARSRGDGLNSCLVITSATNLRPISVSTPNGAPHNHGQELLESNVVVFGTCRPLKLKPARLKPHTAPPPAGGVRHHLKFGWCCWWKQRHSIPMRRKGEPPPEVSAKLSVQSELMMLTPGNVEQVNHSPQEQLPRTNDTTCIVKKTHQRLKFTPCTCLLSGQ